MTTDYPLNTATLTTNACGTTTGDLMSNSTAYYTIPYTTPSIGYSYTYYPYNDSRVTALEAEVKVLREMLAAVLSGRDLPKPARKRRA